MKENHINSEVRRWEHPDTELLLCKRHWGIKWHQRHIRVEFNLKQYWGIIRHWRRIRGEFHLIGQVTESEEKMDVSISSNKHPKQLLKASHGLAKLLTSNPLKIYGGFWNCMWYLCHFFFCAQEFGNFCFSVPKADVKEQRIWVKFSLIAR